MFFRYIKIYIYIYIYIHIYIYIKEWAGMTQTGLMIWQPVKDNNTIESLDLPLLYLLFGPRRLIILWGLTHTHTSVMIVFVLPQHKANHRKMFTVPFVRFWKKIFTEDHEDVWWLLVDFFVVLKYLFEPQQRFFSYRRMSSKVMESLEIQDKKRMR